MVVDLKNRMKFSTFWIAVFLVTAMAGVASAASGDKPNIVVIWGDDIGQSNISAYSMVPDKSKQCVINNSTF